MATHPQRVDEVCKGVQPWYDSLGPVCKMVIERVVQRQPVNVDRWSLHTHSQHAMHIQVRECSTHACARVNVHIKCDMAKCAWRDANREQADSPT